MAARLRGTTTAHPAHCSRACVEVARLRRKSCSKRMNPFDRWSDSPPVAVCCPTKWTGPERTHTTCSLATHDSLQYGCPHSAMYREAHYQQQQSTPGSPKRKCQLQASVLPSWRKLQVLPSCMSHKEASLVASSLEKYQHPKVSHPQ